MKRIKHVSDPRPGDRATCVTLHTCMHVSKELSEDGVRRVTDLSVADCAEGLQVVQGALPSPTRHGPDVVRLPEEPFPWAAYHLVELQQEHSVSKLQHTLWGLLALNRAVMFTQQNHRAKYVGWFFIAFIVSRENPLG